MEKTELGLDQLAKQIKGEGSFVIPETTPKPADIPDDKVVENQEGNVNQNTNGDESLEDDNILNKPIDISDAVNIPPSSSDDNEPPAPKDTQDASLFTPFANVLKEQGVLNEELLKDKKLESIDDLVSVMKEQIDTQAKTYAEAQKQSLTPKGREYLNLIEQGVSPDNALSTVNTEELVNGYTAERLEDINIQKEAVSLYLQSLNTEDSEIKDQLQYLEDMGKLEEKAKTYVSKMQESIKQQKEYLKQQSIQQQELQRKNMETELENLKKKVFTVKEIVPGKVLNDSLKDQLFKSMTTAVGTDPNTGQPINAVAAKRLEDPHSWEMKVHYLTLLGVFDDKWDGILNSVKTDAVKDFEKALRTTSPVTGAPPVMSDDVPDKTKDLLAGFAKFKQALNK